MDSTQYVNVLGTGLPPQQNLVAAARLTNTIVISNISLQQTGATADPPSDLTMIQAVSAEHYGSALTDKIYLEDGSIGYYPDGSSVIGYAPISLPVGSLSFSSYSQLISYLTAPPTPPPPKAIATMTLHFVYGYLTRVKNIGGDLVGGDFVAVGPMPNSDLRISVAEINANPRPPAYTLLKPVLLPDFVSGKTDSMGNFSFGITKNDPGTLMGYFAIGTVVTCCQAIEYYNNYQVTIIWNGLSYTASFSPVSSGTVTREIQIAV